MKGAEKFEFSPENLQKIDGILAKYPPQNKKSALLPLLDLAQRQHSFISMGVMEAVASILDITRLEVFEVATFYSMFSIRPLGRNVIRACRTLPCKLRRGEEITKEFEKELGISLGQTTEDGSFTLQAFECLGACVNAPVVMINDDYYEDLEIEHVKSILDDLRAGRRPKTGSQIGRHSSEAVAD